VLPSTLCSTSYFINGRTYIRRRDIRDHLALDFSI
jgi:hypothetical protein